ncbi:hypothetical protein PRIPAC_79872, partial [Pristionchus pacificus]|uniref:Uncharacterized protein n=1 Tax=Pristionchus pacificus TaxID=54126 RepID=A0A2A6CMW4_PRIPA
GATSFITKGPPCTEYTFVCGGSSIQLNSQVSVYDADDGVTDGKVTVTLTCNDASTWWQYQGSRNIYKIGCYGSSNELTTSTTTESTSTSTEPTTSTTTESTTTSTEPTTSTTAACKTCAAPSPTIDEDFATQPFTSKVKKCNKWTFVCGGYAIEFNDGEQVSDSGDGVPDGKVTMELECSANGATWQFAGVDVTFITCLVINVNMSALGSNNGSAWKQPWVWAH